MSLKKISFTFMISSFLYALQVEAVEPHMETITDNMAKEQITKEHLVNFTAHSVQLLEHHSEELFKYPLDSIDIGKLENNVECIKDIFFSNFR